VSEGPWLAAEAGTAAKHHAPATLRNRDAIAAALAEEIPAAGRVLEVASGSGEHIVHFAARFTALEWQPSDPDPDALASITAWSGEAGLANIAAPLMLDASTPHWPVDRADAILCINMVHISPWAATLGLVAGAARLLPIGGPLILYGPFIEDDVPTAPSNMSFDDSLKARDAAWGLRNVRAVSAAAEAAGLRMTRRTAMPANNLILVYRRV
jgi:SAM-dependent methyltransferase